MPDHDDHRKADADLLARAAYDAYGKVTEGRNVRGEPLPDYDDLGDQVQAAWQAAVVAVVRHPDSRTWV